MGLSVPQDVSVTGFDDIELARIVTPALTTVHLPHRDMGTKAATALIALVEGALEVPAAVKLDTVVTLRDSLGPVPAD